MPHLPICLTRLAMACLALLGSAAAHAAPLALSQAPPNGNSKEPAPNVILTIDDSYSMIDRLDPSDSTSRSKYVLLKSALKATFGDGTANSGIIPDGSIRLAWQAMHNNGRSTGAATLTPGGVNTIKPFSGNHRTNFNDFVNSITPNNGTPSLRMMDQVFNYMRTGKGLHSPWADNPGMAQPDDKPYLECRRSYHVFLTDGAWNSHSDSNKVSKGDSTTQTLGDGTTQYLVTSNQTLVYRDAFGDTNSSKASTFSDFAFRNWATDLQDGNNSTATMGNKVRPLIRKAGTQTYSTSTCLLPNNNCIVTSEFWNPRNNPATWQHLVQHTIGFGQGAVGWTFRKDEASNATQYYTNASLAAASDAASKAAATATDIAERATPLDWSSNNPTRDTFGGDLARVIQGELKWPNVFTERVSWDNWLGDVRSVELWHGAINGRGNYYPVTQAHELTAAFADILNQVMKDTSVPLVSIATNSSSLREGTTAYIAGYSAALGTGTLMARAVDPVSGNISSDTLWSAGDLLDALTPTDVSNRVVLTFNGTAGIAFRQLANLPEPARNALNLGPGPSATATATADSKGQERLDYIRGDNSKAQSAGGPFRDRGSRLGAIVNSEVLYVGAPPLNPGAHGYGAWALGKATRAPMLYVGASDGMLHGFSAATGQERLAYVPQGVAEGKLRNLTDRTYDLAYLVDGSAFSGNAYLDATSGWRTVLVGTLGAGGKGYVVLDVTNPDNFSDANAASLVLTDTTANAGADIGHVVSPPVLDDRGSGQARQIVKLNNGRPAVLLGNGVNSTNEAPVLVVQYLDGTRGRVLLSPCTQPINSTACSYKGSNGLSTPTVVDVDGNGTADLVYAGDIRGQLWKFDLSAALPENWKVGFNNKPMFVAARGGQRQPITSAPYVTGHPAGGLMVVFGTGQNLTNADGSNSAVQTVFGLRDTSPHGTAAQTASAAQLAPINTVDDPSLDGLVQQTYDSTPQTDGGNTYFTSTNNAVNYAGSTPKSGWYLDLPLSGQRVVGNVKSFAGQKVLVESMIPAQSANSTEETCKTSVPSGRRFLSVLNLFSGGQSATVPFVLTSNVTSPRSYTMVENSGGQSVLMRAGMQYKELNSNCPAQQTCSARSWNPGQTLGSRANWRQILH